MAIQSSVASSVGKESALHSHHRHAICWRAIFGGALAAASLTIILCILGSGLGLAVVSPWSSSGISAAAFGFSAIAWLSLTQIVASGMGGFLAGRLRTSAPEVDTDEVYFRDTAHGFLSWSLALLVTAILFASTLGSIINSGVQAGAKVANSTVSSATVSSSDYGYYIDALFRKDVTPVKSSSQPYAQHYVSSAEVRRIFQKSLQDDAISSEDVRYIGQVVAQRTGLTQEEAELRVHQAYQAIQQAETNIKAAADTARKASAYVTLWGFIALLIGAFTASLAATWGGRCRDTLSIK